MKEGKETEKEREVRVGVLIDNPRTDVWARLNATTRDTASISNSRRQYWI